MLICTGDDAREDYEPTSVVVGAAAADLTAAPAPGWDDRMEPYEDNHIGFTR